MKIIYLLVCCVLAYFTAKIERVNGIDSLGAPLWYWGLLVGVLALMLPWGRKVFGVRNR